MRKRTLFFLALAASITSVSTAQVQPVYETIVRPPGVDYLVMRSQHFDVIYQAHTESRARELAAVLENAIVDVDSLFPIAENFRMPVVLSDFGDRGNGYVTPIAFRQEIEAVALNGRTLSPRHPSWFDAVGPHELVHAAQASVRRGFGLSSIVGLFAPDMGRALQMWVPPGISEGAAVLVESGGGAGRLNHDWFNMPFRAAAGSGKAWSLAEMLERPTYTRPGDRFYKGGAQLLQALADSSGGLEAFRRSMEFHSRFPLLGYGVSFWYGTRQMPWSFGRRFRAAAVEREAVRRAALGELTTLRRVAPGRGRVYRNPVWTSDSEVVLYVTGYNLRRGFYSIDVATGSRRRISSEELTEDVDFSITTDRETLVFARYISDPLVFLKDTADLFELDLTTGRTRRTTHGAGLISPERLPDGRLFATRIDGPYTQLVEVRGDGQIDALVSPSRTRYVQLAAAPDGEHIAIIANVGGRQNLYSAPVSNPSKMTALAAFSDGSVYDVAWSPDGRWLVFTADATGPMNVYSVPSTGGVVRRLTNVPYGAFEPAVSPDGQQLALIDYQDERFDLAIMPFEPESGTPTETVEAPDPIRGYAVPDTVGVAWPAGRYRAGKWLRPRLVYPTAYYDESAAGDGNLGIGVGLAIQGADPLQRWSYWTEAFYQDEDVWGEIGIRSGATVLKPGLRVYNRPDAVTALLLSDGAEPVPVRARLEERGVELSASLPILLRDNVHRSTLQLAVFGAAEENRLADFSGNTIRDWTRVVSITPVLSGGLGVQSNLRDIVPTRGLTGFAAAEFELDNAIRGPATSFTAEAGWYVPLLARLNNSIRIEAAVLIQTRSGVFNTDFFMPRGYEDRLPLRGDFYRFGVESVQPLLFPDNGLFVVPAFLSAVYAYGFAERFLVGSTMDFPFTSPENDGGKLTSIGGGLGVEGTLFYVLDLKLRFGWSYRVEDGTWEPIGR